MEPKKYGNQFSPSFNVCQFADQLSELITEFETQTGFTVKIIEIDRETRDMEYNGNNITHTSIKAIPLVIIESR